MGCCESTEDHLNVNMSTIPNKKTKTVGFMNNEMGEVDDFSD